MSERPKPRVFRIDDPALASAPPPKPLDVDPTLPPAEELRRPPPKRSGRWTWFWSALGAFISMALGVAAYDAIAALFARHAWLGWIGLGLGALVLGGLLLFVFGELAALSRLRRLDSLRDRAEAAWSSNDRRQAEAVKSDLLTLYRGRPEFERAAKEIAAREGDAPDADTLLILLEREALSGFDTEAVDAARRAARGVTVATAILPSGLLDAAVVLYLNVRMIREIASAYGGRSGWLESWRLMRQVAFHLAATGAIALGDDLIGAVLGGGALAKLSRRAGEGVINGALTARIGVAAMEVCRPLPFRALERPGVRGIAGAAIRGLKLRSASRES